MEEEEKLFELTKEQQHEFYKNCALSLMPNHIFSRQIYEVKNIDLMRKVTGDLPLKKKYGKDYEEAVRKYELAKKALIYLAVIQKKGDDERLHDRAMEDFDYAILSDFGCFLRDSLSCKNKAVPESYFQKYCR